MLELRSSICSAALLAALAGCGSDQPTDGTVSAASANAPAITLKTALLGQYVTAEGGGGGDINANRAVASTRETFNLYDLNGGDLNNGDSINLQTNNGHFVCAENGGGGILDATRTAASTWETFRIIKLTGGDSVVRNGDAIALQTEIVGRYLSAINGGGANVVADRTAIQSWETFIISLPSQYTLTWSDEFDGAYGPIDGSKWNFDTGNNGWGNSELEYYTNRTDNAVIDGQGHLNIVARAESYGGSGYTSARINTGGKFSQAHGRIEARIKLPSGKGLWPAFWTLGENIGAVGWPTCGELDIMEAVGDFSINHGSAHGPGYSGANGLTGMYRLPRGSLADDFHVYSIEWEPNVVRWHVDGNLYETRTPADLPAGATWVFDHPFFVILNVAVGGTWPGSPDGSTPPVQRQIRASAASQPFSIPLNVYLS